MIRILVLATLLGVGSFGIGYFGTALGIGKLIVRESQPPTCYTFHRAVVIVPAVCAKHDICETPIEAKVCDSILIQGARR